MINVGTGIWKRFGSWPKLLWVGRKGVSRVVALVVVDTGGDGEAAGDA